MSVGESFGSHSLHSFAEFLQHHIDSPEASSCWSSKRKPLKPLNVLKPSKLRFMASETAARKGVDSDVEEHPKICLMNWQKCIKQILKRIMVSARPESNGFDAIGQNNVSNTTSQPKSMLRKVPSKDCGETSYTRTLYPGPEMKLLPKDSIHAWFVGHSLMMHIRRHYSGVVTTICSSATSSLPKTQRSRTRRNLG